MLRKEWKFAYTANELAEAAKKKHAYHTERMSFWEDRKSKVMGLIKEDGIVVKENQSSRVAARRKSWDYEDDTRVMIRQDLNQDLKECSEKLSYHQGKINDYDSWHQVLSAQDNTQVKVDHDDWLFFFGVESTSKLGFSAFIGQ